MQSDMLKNAASAYAKLLGKIYRYTLENGLVIQVQFAPGYFHHLLGLQKIKDVDLVIKGPQNSPNYIFRNILDGLITMDDIKKSRFFDEIDARLRHFNQINRLIEFNKIIVDFDPSLINSKLNKADYILFKRSNDNLFLNLFLMADEKAPAMHVPLTFLPDKTDYYTYGQTVINIISMIEIERTSKGFVKIS